MTDPGSIVGAVSLTIQVLQGLNLYYAQFSAYHDDIRAVVNRIEQVQDNVQLLDNTVARLGRADDAITAAVLTNIGACKAAVNKLESFQKKCGEPDHHPDTIKRKIVLIKRRILYLFRKDTLESIQSQLDRLLENLQVIVQALQLDSSIRFHDQTESKANTILDGVITVSRRQTYQTELLERVDQRIERYFTNTLLHEACEGHEAHKAQTPSIEDKIDGLVSSVERLLQRSEHFPNPTELGESCDQYVNVVQIAKKGVRAHTEPVSQSDLVFSPYNPSSPKCTCLKPKRRRRQTPKPYWISTFWAENRAHSPGCPLAVPSQRSVNTGIQIRVCRGVLGYLIEASLEWSTRSLSPRILVRNIVSDSSPAFRLIDLFHYCFYCDPQNSRDEFQSAFPKMMKALLKLVRDNKCSVSDVDTSGNTIAHHLARSIGLLISVIKEDLKHDVGLVRDAFQFLRDIGCVMNERNIYGSTPMDSFLCRLNFYPQSSLSNLLKQLAQMSVFRDLEYASRYISQGLPERNAVYAAVFSQEALSYGCENNSLTKAIYCQSHNELRTSLENLTDQKPDVEIQSSLHVAANWPLGLQTLLRHGFTDISLQSSWTYSPLDWAIMLENAESAKILLHELAFLTDRTWSMACNWGNPEILEIVASGLYQRFTSVTEGYCPRQSRQWSLKPPDCTMLFHESSMTIGAAQALFKAGFKIVDYNSPDEGTPLFYCTERYRMARALLVAWFLDKGAKLDSISPWGTLPLHILAEGFTACFIRRGHDYEIYKRRMGGESFLNQDQPIVLRFVTPDTCPFCDEDPEEWPLEAMAIHQDIFTTVFESRIRDSCTCRCVVDGCNSISSALRAARPTGCRHQVVDTSWKATTQIQKRALHEIVTYLSNSTHHARICLSALRTMTFDALGLTHTCHARKYYDSIDAYFTEPSLHTAEDIRNTQYVEAEDIELLENLMTEFESAWNEWNGEVLDFIDGHWSVRMEEVLAERYEPRVDEIQKLEEVGVIVSAYGPELPSPAKEVSIFDASDLKRRFEQEVQAIMSGDY